MPKHQLSMNMKKKKLAQPIPIVMQHGANGAHEKLGQLSIHSEMCQKCEMMNEHNKKNEEAGN